MGFLDSIKAKMSGAQQTPNMKAKHYLLTKLTLTEIKKINKEYTGIQGKVDYHDENGIKRVRDATRFELEDAIVAQVPIDIITTIHPKLKKYLEEE